jgi:hypothetical protein
MPRKPRGSLPSGEYVRPQVIVDFENLAAAPHSSADYPLTPGSSIVSPVYDCLTPMYRGIGEFGVTEPQGWTRQIGTTRGAQGPNVDVIRVAGVELDWLFWSVRLASLFWEWIIRWDSGGNPVIAASYRVLPVKGSPGGSLDLQPVAQMVQHLRVPAPYFRVSVTNEEAATNIARDEVLFHLWIRGG